ncbi:Potassium channel subfamily K member 18 [Aphelenchoides fujianensis]|nr:Potassium channel subfamily K member 18 [Aphelenchoides fujianensis]
MLSLASVKLSAARKDEELTKLESGETNIEEIQKLNGGDLDGTQAEDEEKKEEEEELEPIGNTLPLMSIFILYSLLGAAVYLIFISLTSIGLGDVIPRQETYLGLTLVYIAVGLALTTIAIEIAADYLKRLHYFGRKVENQLVKNLGDQFNLPVTTIKTLDLDQFVDDAIKVEAGELETLRPPPIGPSDVMLESPVTFADEDEEPWEPMKTPTPSPTPPPREPTPPEEPSPIPTPPHEPSPEPEPPREPTPPPPPPPPKEPTAEELAALKRRSYSEEAYRRYLAYQKQWRKFRQTQQQFAGPSGRRRSSAATSQASASSSGHRYAPVRSETQESTEEPPKE